VVKRRHSVSCLEKLHRREGDSIRRLHLELFCADYGNNVETPKKPSPTALGITGTTLANWKGERRVHL